MWFVNWTLHSSPINSLFSQVCSLNSTINCYSLTLPGRLPDLYPKKIINLRLNRNMNDSSQSSQYSHDVNIALIDSVKHKSHWVDVQSDHKALNPMFRIVQNVMSKITFICQNYNTFILNLFFFWHRIHSNIYTRHRMNSTVYRY